MAKRRISFVAGEGWPLLLAVALATAIAWRAGHNGIALVAGALLLLLYFLFRDPVREVPPLPLAVVAPVDGRVKSVDRCPECSLPGDWIRITIHANHLGAYTVRAPIEGTIHSVRQMVRENGGGDAPRGLWLRSEEDDDVVLLFPGRNRLTRPQTFVGYGERLGQGQRFAWLRLAHRAEVYVPSGSRVLVKPRERVLAGSGVLAELVHEPIDTAAE